MTDASIKADTTVPLRATLPIELTGATSVKFHVGKENTTTIDTTIVDKPNGVVEIPIGNHGLAADRLYLVEFEITYKNGDVETRPRDGYDTLKIEKDLA